MSEPTCRVCGHGNSLHGGDDDTRIVGARCWRKRCRCRGYVADRRMKAPGPPRRPAPVGPTRRDFAAHRAMLKQDLIRFRCEAYGRLSRAGLVVWACQDGARLLARNAVMCGAVAERGGDARFGRWCELGLVTDDGRAYNEQGEQLDHEDG